MSYQKIDETGKYCPFPGVTVVSMVKPEDSEFWKTFQTFLAQDAEIAQYFSPLPSESYHATTMNLTTASEVKGSFEDFIKNFAWFHLKLAEELKLDAKDLPLEFNGVHAQGVIQLVVNFPEEQRQRIFKLADNYDMPQKVPPFFHMTLAYQFRLCDSAVLIGITQRLNDKFKVLFEGKKINLMPPALSSFEDMASFKPWNGSDYPFNKKQSFEPQSMFHHAAKGNLTTSAPKLK